MRTAVSQRRLGFGFVGGLLVLLQILPRQLELGDLVAATVVILAVADTIAVGDDALRQGAGVRHLLGFWTLGKYGQELVASRVLLANILVACKAGGLGHVVVDIAEQSCNIWCTGYAASIGADEVGAVDQVDAVILLEELLPGEPVCGGGAAVLDAMVHLRGVTFHIRSRVYPVWAFRLGGNSERHATRSS
jgi:hypothetical protein